jgi:hypothetical protein
MLANAVTKHPVFTIVGGCDSPPNITVIIKTGTQENKPTETRVKFHHTGRRRTREVVRIEASGVVAVTIVLAIGC